MYYVAIFELWQTKKYPIEKLCQVAGVSRSGYYKWKTRQPSATEKENKWLAQQITRIFEESDRTFGVVRMHYALKREVEKKVNIKKIRRLMRLMGLFPEIRKKRSEWTRTVPFHIDENIIQRDFHADKPNQKWFTDVSCLFYGNHQKAYLSAIIDRYDMSIVSYVISQRNDNQLVIDTVKNALQTNPNASPIIHSDRGFQYMSNVYQLLKKKYGFTSSMSRAGKCLDNQPIESFWGTLKSEYYYRKEFTSYDELKKGINSYMHFYQNKRYVPKFNGLTPREFREKAS
ncbi:putative transposase InsK for insertion sequence element [Listeria fleischmannii 1991]|uniref:Putative transposase InsK for insertion sequence element n=1 Tax=Listeria fleischmannii 1991 TaxID=1430899 RepID=A0A0J8GCP6_9LIST|nr:IS3 family transposase [Listeria fleischmannii]KMT60370.1 putative transposase InsK for insertion sequence element [Listeria fleischmannii 1991]